PARRGGRAGNIRRAAWPAPRPGWDAAATSRRPRREPLPSPPRPACGSAAQAPLDAAPPTGLRGRVGPDRLAEILITASPPDLVDRFPKNIPQHDAVIVRGDPGRDTARQHVAVHRHVSERPGPAAGAPRLRIRRRAEADLRRGGTGGAEVEVRGR